MIVTRQRRKPFPWKRLILPLVAIALVVVALSWQPSRSVIANGPAAPVWRTLNNALGGVATPFHFAAQNQLLTERNKQIVQLQGQIADLANEVASKGQADLVVAGAGRTTAGASGGCKRAGAERAGCKAVRNRRSLRWQWCRRGVPAPTQARAEAIFPRVHRPTCAAPRNTGRTWNRRTQRKSCRNCPSCT